MLRKGTETTPRPMAFLTVIARKYKRRIFALINYIFKVLQNLFLQSYLYAAQEQIC